MIPFDFHPRTRIVFGPNKVDTLGELAGEMGIRRALLVSDPGIVAAGHAERGLSALRKAGIDVHLFDGVKENPTTDNVEAGLALARRYDPELLVGVGGGSSMDCAKGINFVFTNGGRMQDYWGTGRATKPMLPMIAVPTTAGTGSEAQSYALVTDSKTHVKMACGDKKATFRVALLDPVLTVTQPQRHRAYRDRCDCTRTGKLRDEESQSRLFGVQPGSVAHARRQILACARESRRSGGTQRHAAWRVFCRAGHRK